MSATSCDSPSKNSPAYDGPAYRQAYSRINGMVVVGRAWPTATSAGWPTCSPRPRGAAAPWRHGGPPRPRLRGLRPQPGREGRRRSGAAAALPLQQQFQQAEAQGDLVGCLVIQCLIIECFAVAAYRLYLPVADPYAAPITAAVMADEQEHLNYGEQWLRPRFAAVADQVEACARRAVPVALGMLEQLRGDLATIGIDPTELVAEFVVLFQESLQAIGTDAGAARQLVNRLAARALA